MRKILLFGSLMFAVLSTGFWFFSGAHQGWTQTSVKIEQLDEITGLIYPTYQDKLVPGLDFLFASLILAFILCLIAWLFFKPAK